MENFDASKVLQNRPWIERALDNVAPQWSLKRLEARVSKALFEYNASQSSRIYHPRRWACRPSQVKRSAVA